MQLKWQKSVVLRMGLVLCALCFSAAWIMGQVISTRHQLNATAQLILHMDGLENSWEVMNARAEEGGKNTTGEMPDLPSDEILRGELRYLLGDVRLDLTDRVKEFIQLYAKHRRSTTEAMLGVATVYAPVIERKITELHMPPVIGMLPAALSAFHLRAISEDGASGLWQLNYYVATKQGLLCNATVDERRDLYKSTRAALGYLSDLNRGYNNWAMSLAAYTCGPAGIERARNRAGEGASFEALYPYLPERERDIVPAFAAAAYVMTHAKQLGLKPLRMQVMPLPDRIQLQEPLKFAHVANALGIPEAELRNMNPVCRTEMIPGINMPVQLCLPQGYGQRFEAMKDSLYQQQLRLEAAKKVEPPKVSGTSGETNENPKPIPAAPKPYAPPAGTSPVTYTIKSGDNVGLIAQWFGLSSSEVRQMNGLPNDKIKAGDKLTLHVPKAKAASLAKLETMSFEEKQALSGGTATAPNPKPHPVTPQPSAGITWHTVKSGENLWVIAKKYPGVSAEDIMKANGISEKLQPGMKLKIPTPKK